MAASDCRSGHAAHKNRDYVSSACRRRVHSASMLASAAAATLQRNRAAAWHTFPGGAVCSSSHCAHSVYFPAMEGGDDHPLTLKGARRAARHCSIPADACADSHATGAAHAAPRFAEHCTALRRRGFRDQCRHFGWICASRELWVRHCTPWLELQRGLTGAGAQRNLLRAVAVQLCERHQSLQCGAVQRALAGAHTRLHAMGACRVRVPHGTADRRSCTPAPSVSQWWTRGRSTRRCRPPQASSPRLLTAHLAFLPGRP